MSFNVREMQESAERAVRRRLAKFDLKLHKSRIDGTYTVVPSNGVIRGYLYDGTESWFKTVYDVHDFVKQLEERYAG